MGRSLPPDILRSGERPPSADQLILERQGDGAGAARNAEFAQNAAHVEVGCGARDHQAVCNLLIRETADEQAQDLELARAEIVAAPRRARRRPMIDDVGTDRLEHCKVVLMEHAEHPFSSRPAAQLVNARSSQLPQT